MVDRRLSTVRLAALRNPALSVETAALIGLKSPRGPAVRDRRAGGKAAARLLPRPPLDRERFSCADNLADCWLGDEDTARVTRRKIILDQSDT